MLPVVWLDEARDVLHAITEYVTDWNPLAALELEMQITDSAQSLAQFPYAGRTGRVSGTRELLAHPNYWLIYRVTLENVEVLGVLHVRREYP